MLLNQGLQHTPTTKTCYNYDLHTWNCYTVIEVLSSVSPYFAVDTKSLSSPPPSSNASSVLASPVDWSPITTHCTGNRF